MLLCEQHILYTLWLWQSVISAYIQPCCRPLAAASSTSSTASTMVLVASLVSLSWSSTEVSENVKSSLVHSRMLPFCFLQRGVVAVAIIATLVVQSVSPRDGLWNPFVMGGADVGLASRLPQCTTRSLLRTIQPLYYAPVDSWGHLADVAWECVWFWTALYPLLLSISGSSHFWCHWFAALSALLDIMMEPTKQLAHSQFCGRCGH